MTGETAGHVLTQRDFDRFAALSRDDSPIHRDPDFARTTHFGATVARTLMFPLLAQIHGSHPNPSAVHRPTSSECISSIVGRRFTVAPTEASCT
nr:MaoC/PaaZ C-terminal domain-containing protein [Cupriavidus numazuensis]